MVRSIFPFLALLIVASCGVVKKKTTYSEKRKVTVEATKEDRVDDTNDKTLSEVVVEAPERTDRIINTALTYSGVRYKYGGTTSKGMDCSGLLYVAFGAHDVSLPRVSYQMAEEGRRIKINKVSKGDLLFFKTSKRGKRINHVGLVVAVEDDDIKFIHSTTSRGVIVSSLREGFWNYAFVKATRVL